MAIMENFTTEGRLHFEKYNLNNDYKELNSLLRDANTKLGALKGENYHIVSDYVEKR